MVSAAVVATWGRAVAYWVVVATELNGDTYEVATEGTVYCVATVEGRVYCVETVVGRATAPGVTYWVVPNVVNGVPYTWYIFFKYNL